MIVYPRNTVTYLRNNQAVYGFEHQRFLPFVASPSVILNVYRPSGTSSKQGSHYILVVKF